MMYLLTAWRAVSQILLSRRGITNTISQRFAKNRGMERTATCPACRPRASRLMQRYRFDRRMVAQDEINFKETTDW